MGKKHQNATAARARALSNSQTPSADSAPSHSTSLLELLNSVTEYNFIDVEPNHAQTASIWAVLMLTTRTLVARTDNWSGRQSQLLILSEFSGDELEENRCIQRDYGGSLEHGVEEGRTELATRMAYRSDTTAERLFD